MKLLVWVGASKDDYIAFPAEVQDEMGYALYQAQIGKTPRQAKMLKGIKTSKRDIDMIDRRLRDARDIDRARGERRCAVTCPSTRSAAATCSPTSACRMPSFTC
jgi:phage-related protein